MLILTMTLKYLSHHYHLPMNPQNLPEHLECKKFEVHSNAPITPPCPTSKHTGEAQYPTF